MKFEKLFLISSWVIGFAFSSSLLSVSHAAEKLPSMEAIWNSAEINIATTKNVSKKRVASKKDLKAQQVERQRMLAARQKRKQQALAKVNAKQKAQQLALKTQEAQKLARQRAVWRAKWEAQQKAKKQAEIAQRTAPKVATKAPVRTAQVAPKPLTREQYQWRWKQAQLKKQQQLNKQRSNSSTPLLTNTDAKKYARNKPATSIAKLKPSHATFRQNKNSAIMDSLPLAVSSKLQAAKLSTYAMSAYVQDVNSPRPLLGHKEETSRVPASVMKLITSYAALGTLGPNYRWPLDIFTKGIVRNGTLQGDLIVKGYGSPEFNQHELRKVLKGIKQKGIRNVNGRIVFDNSYFNVSNLPSFDGKSQSAYNAQPDALLYNERINTFQVRASGKRVHVSNTTPTHNLKVVNRMRKTRRGCRPRINVSRKGVQTVVTFSGKFSSRCGTRTYSRVISRPSEMIYGAMQAMWKRDVGGTLKTRFAMGRTPRDAKPLLRTHSRTLAQILPTIDKDSNNVMARQVLLTIGARTTGQQGTQRNGANAIGQWLVSRGLNFPELRIENGSGLSRTARISARHVGDLLVDAYRSPYRNILMQSLAVAGVDGTMKRRLKKTKVRGRGFFKTGTLRDVRSIAGYVKAANGKTYVMAILHNDPRAKRRALAAHDTLIEWVYSGGRQQLAMR